MEPLYYLEGAKKMYIYEDKVVIKKTGFLNSILGETGEKTIPMSSITAVTFKKANIIYGGHLKLSVSGESRSGINTDGEYNIMEDDNAVTFISRSLNNLAEEIHDYLQQRINDLLKSASTQTVFSAAQPSSFSELSQFKQMLDSGLITQEEYDAKKKQILGL